MYNLFSAQADRQRKNEKQSPRKRAGLLQGHQGQKWCCENGHWKKAPQAPHQKTPTARKHQYSRFPRSKTRDSFSTITTAAETPDCSDMLMVSSQSRQEGVPMEVCIPYNIFPSREQTSNRRPACTFALDQYDRKNRYGTYINHSHTAEYAGGNLRTANGKPKGMKKHIRTPTPHRHPSVGSEYLAPPLRTVPSMSRHMFGEI